MIAVKPIKDRRLLNEILRDLSHDKSPHGRRMYLLFATGIYTGLRIVDILNLRICNVSGPTIKTVERKTGKQFEIAIHPVLASIYNVRLAGKGKDELLFPSSQPRVHGMQQPISTRQAEYDMALIKKRYALPFPFSCHSMRKTFGYMYYKQNNGDLEGLRQIFNHSNTAVTRRYIGIDDEERNEKIARLNMGYVPEEKPQRAARDKDAASESLMISRLDRSRQGQMYGQRTQERLRKARAEKGAGDSAQ